jgi:hypothetical protein
MNSDNPLFKLKSDPITRSPQADIIDQLIWENIGRFWVEAYDPENKDALSSVYEACFHALDAEYIRLFEVNNSKSLQVCPVISQRRWVRLDLNRYDELRAFLRFINPGRPPGSKKKEDTQDELDCDNIPTHHAKHWHISFPWTIKQDKSNTRINIGYPVLTTALAWVYKMYDRGDGVVVGRRLKPKLSDGMAPSDNTPKPDPDLDCTNTVTASDVGGGSTARTTADAGTSDTSTAYDYEILSDGTTIFLRNAQPGDMYELVVAVDLGGADYENFQPHIHRVDTFIGDNAVAVPMDMSNGLPVHVMVVRNSPNVGAGDLLDTNNTAFTTRREFYQYTGDATLGGVQHGYKGQVVLPVGTVLNPDTDTVFVFGLIEGEFDTVHVHNRATITMTPDQVVQISLDGIREFTPELGLEYGLFGSIDFLAQPLQIWINGKLLSPTEYRYSHGTNTFYFKKAHTAPQNSVLKIDVLSTSERRATEADNAPFHMHQQCFRAFVITKKEWGTFDDGGQFDENPPKPEIFDDLIPRNVVSLADVDADPETVEVYTDGYLNVNVEDYTLTQSGRDLIITFKHDIDGMSVLVTYRRESLIYVYGLHDIVPVKGTLNLNTMMIQNMLADLNTFVRNFEKVYGAKISNLARLLEAAFIAANGGNPMLSLFLDEFMEYDGLPLDAANQILTALQARNVESANTDISSIPFLVDHVLHPTIRLEEGKDFKVIEGEVQSSMDLMKPRGPDDEAPGVWWCPVLYLDEHLLAKNFGSLVEDIQDSSLQYKNSLVSNYQLRYAGPNLQSVERAAAVMMGSPMFTQDSKIKRVYTRLIGYAVTIRGDTITQVQTEVLTPDQTRPYVGMRTFVGQSIGFPLLVDSNLSTLADWEPGVLRVNQDLSAVRAEDKIRITLYDPDSDPADTTARSSTVEMKIKGVSVSPILGGVQTTLILNRKPRYVPRAFGHMWIYRDVGAPRSAFNGSIQSVVPITRTVITTEFEEFELKPGEPVEYRVGDIIYRGMPVYPGLAKAYDHVTRPDWHWLSPEDNQQFWDNYLSTDPLQSARRLTSRRFVTLLPPLKEGGFSQAIFSDPYPIPERGTVIEFYEDNTCTKQTFTVVGVTRQIDPLDLDDAVAATTTNILLVGVQTVDGHNCQAGDRVLVKNQVDAAQNGTYLVNEGSWERTSDVLDSGSRVYVTYGAVNGNKTWELITPGTILAGQTAISFEVYTFTEPPAQRVVLVTPAVKETMSGTAIFRDKSEIASAKEGVTAVMAAQKAYDKNYFEVTPTLVVTEKNQYSLPTARFAYVHQAGVPVIELTSAVGFPKMGRAHVFMANGGIVEFEYFGLEGTRMLSVKWREPFTALRSSIDNQGNFVYNLQLPLDSEIVLAATYEDKRLNPGFIQLVYSRVEYVQRNLGDKLEQSPRDLVTRDNADEFYALLKNTSAILELRALTEPLALRNLLRDVAPVGSTLEVVNRHVLIDQYGYTANDQVPVGDRRTMTIEIVGPDDFTGGTLHLPTTTPAVLLRARVTDPDAAGPYTYFWRIASSQGSGNEKLSTPRVRTTRFSNLSVNGRYVVELTVSNGNGQTRTVSMIILVDEILT